MILAWAIGGVRRCTACFAPEASKDPREPAPHESCPLNHRTAHRSYPQLWRSGSVQDRNRPVWPSDPGRRAELQACKLPTVWITPVDNYPARDVRRVPTPGNARKCKTHAGHGALWKTATSCGNALRRQGPDRPDVAECLRGKAAGRRSRPVTFTLTPPRPRKSVVAGGAGTGAGTE